MVLADLEAKFPDLMTCDSLPFAGVALNSSPQRVPLLGINKLYAASNSAIGTFEGAGWFGFDQVFRDNKVLTIFAGRLSW